MKPKRKNYSEHCRACAKSVWQATRRMDEYMTNLRAAAYAMGEEGENTFKITDKAIHEEMVKLHQWMETLSDWASWWADAMGQEQYDFEYNEDNTNPQND